MIKIAEQLADIISEYSEKLYLIPEEKFTLKVSASKWSNKEELGHLVDSAHNNLRRFVVSQYEENPKVVYDQNFWNEAFSYQHQPSKELVDLWKLLNQQVCFVLKSMPEKNSALKCNTGKEQPKLHSIEWIAEDYIRHLLHHVHHILELEEIPY